MTKDKNILYRITVILLLLMVAFLCFLTSVHPVAYADTTNDVIYSNVIDDLKKDVKFDVNNYPIDADVDALSVVQLAESVNNELFVYVYNPDCKKVASSINISTSIGDSIKFNNYKLKLLNSKDALSKYLVVDFSLINNPTRYYSISSIFRFFDSKFDKAVEGNKITEVSYPVNKEFCFSVINGKSFCSVVDTETIVVTDKFVGFCRYTNGFTLVPSSCDSHFVAFNTDRPIDKLLEADVFYTQQSYNYTLGSPLGVQQAYGEKIDKVAELTYTDKVEHTGSGLFAPTYKWDRISTVEDFIKNENITQDVYTGATFNATTTNVITDEGLERLKGKKWILRFAETDFSSGVIDGKTMQSSTIVGDVSILRLKFKTDGITYNLGVVDNKQTGSDTPINKEETNFEPSENWKRILGIILGIIILILVIFLLSPILPYIVKFLLWIILLPFKLIAALINLFKNKKEE